MYIVHRLNYQRNKPASLRLPRLLWLCLVFWYRLAFQKHLLMFRRFCRLHGSSYKVYSPHLEIIAIKY